MEFLTSFFRRLFLSILFLNFFNLMAFGIDLYIPVSIFTISIIAIFDIFGIVVLIIFYLCIF